MLSCFINVLVTIHGVVLLLILILVHVVVVFFDVVVVFAPIVAKLLVLRTPPGAQRFNSPICPKDV